MPWACCISPPHYRNSENKEPNKPNLPVPRFSSASILPRGVGDAGATSAVPPIPTQACAAVPTHSHPGSAGSHLLASSASIRSRSGSESSQSRMVSLSSPLWQVREGSQGLHLLTGAGSRKVTHLQARSPRALATVQSRPVALRPMVPTTVSLTYCLDKEEGGEVPFLVLFQGSGGGVTSVLGYRFNPGATQQD